MSDNKEENSVIFKWYGWGSPIGLGAFIVACAFAAFLLALAGWLYIK
jgi:hypothetical protein